jgi:putative endonuclease
MWFVYILKCSDGTFYTGCTSNLEERIKRHLKGENTYTRYRLPVLLITYFAFNDKYKAYAFEKYLKSGSGKAFAK